MPVGQSGWGIALFIDGMLAPVLRVRRNVTYTFIVEAGDDVNDGPNYHPFYITNSIDGGILLDTPEQRAVSVNMIAYNYYRKHIVGTSISSQLLCKSN